MYSTSSHRLQVTVRLCYVVTVVQSLARYMVTVVPCLARSHAAGCGWGFILLVLAESIHLLVLKLIVIICLDSFS